MPSAVSLRILLNGSVKKPHAAIVKRGTASWSKRPPTPWSAWTKVAQSSLPIPPLQESLVMNQQS